MKHYIFNGKSYTTLPDPFKADSGEVSPVSEGVFVALGGTIEDDGELSPKEKFIGELTEYLDGLEDQCKELGLQITVSDFYLAASTMFSTELVDWATEQGVPPDMIEEVRQQMLVYIADASRLGLTWNDIFTNNAK